MLTKAKLRIEPKSKLLDGLNDAQKQAVEHGEGPLLIVAGAGTGKTTVITRRVAYLIEKGIKPESILVLAFGNRAAAEMEERLDELLPYGVFNLQVSTFHAFCELILHNHGLEIGLPDFKALDEVGQWLLIRNNLEKFKLDYYRPLGNPTRFIKALVQHFSRAKDELVSVEEYLEYAEGLKLSLDRAEAGTPHLNPLPQGERKKEEEVANAYHTYQRLMLANNYLDFGDLINYTLKLFRERPGVLEFYRRRFQYILVDEFQDTNYAQYELLKFLAAPKNNITVVGDDDQSIYKFRGASISNILHFREDYPKSEFVSLTENYRSGQAILDAAYDFIRQNDPDRLEHRLKISKKLAARTKAKGEISALLAPDFIAEADMVAAKILQLLEANPELTLNDFAILARSHDTLVPFVNKLEERGISYLYFASRGLYQKGIVFDLLSYFRLLDDYHEPAALYHVLNFAVFKISRAAIVELASFAKRKSLSLYEVLERAATVGKISEQDFAGITKLLGLLAAHTEMARQKSAGELLVEIVKDLNVLKAAAGDYSSAKYLETFRKRIQNFETQSPDRSLRAFMQELKFEQEAGGLGALEFDPEAGPEAVKLMTVHAAKGLEFQYVFIVGLVDKRFPSLERKEQIELPADLIKDILPEGDVHLEEERRLFYVALTRAKIGLFLTRAFDYGGKLTKRPSRFLQEMGLAGKEVSKPTGEVKFFKAGKKAAAFPAPNYFSFSQISTFRGCPLEYKYRYILKLPFPGSASLSFGQTIHVVFEKYLNLFRQQQNAQDLFGKKSNELPALEELKKIYEREWVDDWFESRQQMEEYRKEGLKMLKEFYEECAARPPATKFLEEKFKLRLKGGWFGGKIDRADETPMGLVIIDYKTGAVRPVEKVDREQLLVYQWAAQDFFHEKVASLQYWFLRDKLEKREFLGSDKDLAAVKAGFEETIEEILRAARDDSFYEADLRHSHTCKFRELEH